LFSFDNRAWEALLLLLSLVLVFLAYVGKLRFPAESRITAEDGGLTKRIVVLCSVITAALACVLIWVVLPVGAVNDGAYFLDRIHLMQQGAVPFRDFEFIYGTGALYASLWISRLPHLSVIAGYYIVWFIETLVAVPLLWQALRWTDLPAGGKAAVFWLFYAFGLTDLLGAALNYTLFRYALPFFLLTAVAAIDRSPRVSARVAVVLWGTGGTALLLLVSPEEGLVFAVACCLFLPVRRWSLRRPFVIDTASLMLLCGGLAVEAFRAGSFLTMSKFGVGAFNLPDWPGPAVLFTVFCLLLTLVYLATGDIRKKLPGTTTLLAIYGVGIIPGAFGRCDPVHLEGYEMPVLACGLLLCWPYRRVWRGAIAWAWIFLFTLPFLTSQWRSPVYSKVLLLRLYRGGPPQDPLGIKIDAIATKLAEHTLGVVRGRTKMEALRAASSAHSVDPHQIFPSSSKILFAPFDYRPSKVTNYQDPTLDKGYFMGMLNVLSPAQVDEKIRELQQRPAEDLVLSWEDFTECSLKTGDRAELRALLLLPWVPAPSRTLSYRLPFCSYIRSHYHWVAEPSVATFSYGLMRNNALVEQGPPSKSRTDSVLRSE